jgi:signal transduction histidine kinase/CheY-like chemotaxis protein
MTNTISTHSHRHRVLRSFLAFFVPIVIALVTLVTVLYWLRLQADLDNASRNATTLLTAQKVRIENILQSSIADLRIAATHHALTTIVEDDHQEEKQVFAEELRDFTQFKKIYDQARYFDANGMEIVRINYNGGNPTIIPIEQLQNKADRYYFRDTIGLPRNSIYISPLDLNIEHGMVEQPLKPMIRFCIPIYGRDDTVRGVVTLNYLAQNLLTIVGEYDASSSYPQTTSLLNAQGYWLKADDPADEWGFAFPERNQHSFAARYPAHWQRITEGAEFGQFKTPDGLLTFAKVYPWRKGDIYFAKDGANGEHSVLKAQRDTEINYQWILVSHTPQTALRAESQYLLKRMVIVATLLIFLMALGTWKLAGARVARQRAEQELLAAKQDLEVRVEQRTTELSEVNRALQQKIIQYEQAETEKQTMQSMLLQAQKMEAIGTLAGGIAHDFNNLLTIILGYTELATLSLQDKPKIEAMLQTALDAGGRARDLVQQILTFSRRHKSESETILVSSMIKEALKLIRSSLPSTIEIVQHIDGEAGYIRANATQVHQLIMNLCTNAAHAMEQNGGTLTVSLERLVGERAENILHVSECIFLQVTDTGVGMSAEIRERVFEPYFTTKEPDKGTGLGLAVVHGIIKECNGHIAVDSTPGQGSKFQLYFPAFHDDASPQQTEHIAIAQGSGNVLFIDDEEDLTTLGGSILTKAGYRVSIHTDPYAALAEFARDSQHFDAIITDHTMPGMTGVQLSKKLRQIRPDISILLCTGYRLQEITQHIEEGLINAYLPKPYTVTQLQESVSDLLQKKR